MISLLNFHKVTLQVVMTQKKIAIADLKLVLGDREERAIQEKRNLNLNLK
jgi:hypothetical protein